MKTREAYFRPYDNQMMMEMYAVRAKEPVEDEGPVGHLRRARHGARAPARTLEVIAPPQGRQLQDAGDPVSTLQSSRAARLCPRAGSQRRCLVGAYYLLIALGLSLIFALGGIVNLAHGGFYAIGAYLAVVLAPTHRICRRVHSFADRWSVRSGIAIERLLFRRFYRSDPILSLLVDVRAGARHRAGPARSSSARRRWHSPIPPELRGQIFIGDFIYPRYRLIDLRRRGRGGDSHLAHRLPHGIRSRCARRSAKPGRGRRARHLARALYDGDRCARRRTCRPCRRAARADRRRASGDGRRDPHRRFRRGRHRRARLVLGRDRGRRCWSASCAGVTIYFNPSWGEASMYLLMAAGAAAATARAVRRAHPEIRMTRIRRDELPLALAALTLVLLPFVLDVVGLPLRYRDRRGRLMPSPAWGSTFSSAIPASCRSAMARGSGLAPMPPRISQRHWFAGGVILPAHRSRCCSLR